MLEMTAKTLSQSDVARSETSLFDFGTVQTPLKSVSLNRSKPLNEIVCDKSMLNRMVNRVIN